jgi:hypothetical protein
MNIEQFRTLSPQDQQTVLRARRQRVEEALRNAGIEEGINRDLEATLVPQIIFKKELDLPTPPDRDTAVRNLFRSDDSLVELKTRDGVIYRR